MCPDDPSERTEERHETEWGRREDDVDERRAPGQQSRRRQSPRQRRKRRGYSLPVNALIGGVVGIVLSFIPFSTVIGGAVAGYLEAGSQRHTNPVQSGLLVGGFAGAVTFLPILLLGYLVFGVVASTVGLPLGGAVAVVFLLLGLYSIGPAMVGGMLGVMLRREGEDEREPQRW